MTQDDIFKLGFFVFVASTIISGIYALSLIAAHQDKSKPSRRKSNIYRGNIIPLISLPFYAIGLFSFLSAPIPCLIVFFFIDVSFLFFIRKPAWSSLISHFKNQRKKEASRSNLPAVSSAESPKVLEIKGSGINSTVNMEETKLVINRQGAFGSLLPKGETAIPYDRILSIQCVEPGMITRGYIYIQIACTPATLPLTRAAASPNTIMLDRIHLREYLILKEFLLEKLENNRQLLKSDPSPEVKCPNCRSTQIAAKQKGYSWGKAAAGVVLTGGIGLLAGGIGSKQIVVTCLNCGHTWQPGQH